MSPSLRFPFSSTLTIAHRGAHGDGHPENSLEAVERAVELSVPGVEFDVCNLRDGEMVVSHDVRVRVGERTVSLPATSSDSLRDGLPPRLEPFLELVAGSDVFLNLDWKGVAHEGRIGRLLGRYRLEERTIVSSLDHRALSRLKQDFPKVATGLSVGPLPAATRDPQHLPEEVLSRARDSRTDAVMLNKRLASEEIVEAARRRKTGIFFWTARDEREYESLLDYSPDGIATDALARRPEYIPQLHGKE
ncbi:hypothetical protein Rxycam_01046 [Rubrobacter xylanophilus DSM 9941]|uniref:glycerophosphodiester phosphodiesterase n=1 Tax=Rubrobacter xylanophilus TaxID=49319 RepID=UPI001C643BB2|nr:glycerophosphodiester phosphodiesterase [Rubrobacter xylanophilus]QYJ15231.1 hypothetical protein Rxycam_01046 [Rubrobacter xylanophilus DSM 9941]